jgi:hypothetical protein
MHLTSENKFVTPSPLGVVCLLLFQANASKHCLCIWHIRKTKEMIHNQWQIFWTRGADVLWSENIQELSRESWQWSNRYQPPSIKTQILERTRLLNAHFFFWILQKIWQNTLKPRKKQACECAREYMWATYPMNPTAFVYPCIRPF